MRAEPSASPAAGPRHQRFRHHQVHEHAVGRFPCARFDFQFEPGFDEGANEVRVVAQQCGVDGEIGVSRGGGDGELSVSGVQVDGLSADEDQCIEVGLQCLEYIEERLPRAYVFAGGHSVHSSSWSARVSMSCSASCGPRPGLVNRSATV